MQLRCLLTVSKLEEYNYVKMEWKFAIWFFNFCILFLYHCLRCGISYIVKS